MSVSNSVYRKFVEVFGMIGKKTKNHVLSVIKVRLYDLVRVDMANGKYKIVHLQTKDKKKTKKIDSGKVDLLPEGIYNFKIECADLVDNCTTGKTEIQIRFTVIGGKYDGIQVHDRFIITNNPNGLRAFKAFLYKIGKKVQRGFSEFTDKILETISNEQPCVVGKFHREGRFEHVYVLSLLKKKIEEDIPEPVEANEMSPIVVLIKAKDGKFVIHWCKTLTEARKTAEIMIDEGMYPSMDFRVYRSIKPKITY